MEERVYKFTTNSNKKKKWSPVQTGIVAVVFVATILAALAAMHFLRPRENTETETVYAEMTEAGTLPVVQIVWEKQPINTLYGTRERLGTVSLWDSTVPVSVERTFSFQIAPNEAEVNDISYRVRATGNGKLMEEGKVKKWETDEETGELHVEMTFSNLLEEKQEYQLEIGLKTKEYGELYYHTRLYCGPQENIVQLMDFARIFSDATFDKKQAEAVLVPYILTGQSRDNQDLSHVDLYNKFSALTWGTLAPEIQGAVQTRIQELSSTQISLSFQYQIRSESDDDTSSLFDVHEFFCLRVRDGHIYILDYERDMTEQFTAAPADLHENGIYLGVGADYSDVTASENGTYLAFVKGGQVWLLDTKEKHLQKVFGWQDGLQDSYAVQIIRATEDGTLDFLVYGYVAAGVYEGDCQIQCYRYHTEETGEEIKETESLEDIEDAEETESLGETEDAEETESLGETEDAEETNNTEETETEGTHTTANNKMVLELLFYLPVEEFGKTLEAHFGDVEYINEADRCYLLLGSVLYRISLTDGKSEVVQDELRKGHYCVNPAGNRMAWETGNGQEQSEVICELNMDTGEIRDIFPKEGTVVLAGFIESDLVYGVNESGETGKTADGSVVDPCDRVCIVSPEGELVREYTDDDRKILQIDTYDNYIAMTMGQEVDGVYRETGREKLLSGQKVTTGVYANIAKRVTGQKLTEAVIEGTTSLGLSRYSVSDALPLLILENLKTPNITWKQTETGLYYAFGEGRLLAVCDTASEAIGAVVDMAGVVRDADMRQCWNKELRDLYVTLPIEELKAETEEDTLATCMKILLEQDQVRRYKVEAQLQAGKTPEAVLESQLNSKFCDLQGSQVSWLLYYINTGSPVLAVTGEQTAVLLVGYDTGHIMLYDPVQGQYTMTIEEAEAFFAERGSWFMTYLPGES